MRKIAYKTSSSSDGSAAWSGLGFSPVTGMVVEIPVAMGAREGGFGFLCREPAAACAGVGVEPREEVDVRVVEVVFLRWRLSPAKVSGEILLRVGDSSEANDDEDEMLSCLGEYDGDTGAGGACPTGKPTGLLSAKAIIENKLPRMNKLQGTQCFIESGKAEHRVDRVQGQKRWRRLFNTRLAKT